MLVRAPVWLILLLLLAALGVGVYAYFTTPLPYGLSAIIRTPGSESFAPATATPVANVPAGRTVAGQPLVLGATSVQVQSVLRNQDLTTGGRGGPPGAFTVLDLVVQNTGSQPLTAQPVDFRLVDERGRVYAVDLEATRNVNATAKRRVLFDATVPPTATVATLLAFETASDAVSLSLRVTLGYGELELPQR